MATTIYGDPQISEKRTKGELAQIGVLSLIILVFFVIAASNAVSLLVSAFHR